MVFTGCVATVKPNLKIQQNDYDEFASIRIYERRLWHFKAKIVDMTHAHFRKQMQSKHFRIISICFSVSKDSCIHAFQILSQKPTQNN